MTQAPKKPSYAAWFGIPAALGLLGGLLMGLDMSGQFAFALGMALPAALILGVIGLAVCAIVRMVKR